MQELSRKVKYKNEQGSEVAHWGRRSCWEARSQSSPWAVVGIAGGFGGQEEPFGSCFVSWPE